MTHTTWHARYPELGTHPIPIEPYISQEYFDLERERIFRRAWLHVGREEQITKPGDYVVKDLPAARTSVLIVRGKDGKIRAFHNVCSHRSNKLMWGKGGSCQVFSCKFHGWAYNTEGNLSFVPDEEGFFNLKKNALGLTPVACEVWEGFVFINLDRQPQQALQDYLGELGQSLVGYPFPEVSQTRFVWRTEIHANWKVAQDAFQEAYHLAFLHKQSLPDSFSSKENPFCHSFAYKICGSHRRMSIYGNPEHKPTPVEMLAQQAGASIVKRESAVQALPPGVNPERSRYWSSDIVTFFPNFSVIVFDGTYIFHQFWPLAVDRTLWEVGTCFPKAQNAWQRFSQEYSKVLTRDVLLEDGSTLEMTQSVLASGAKTHYVLQDQELLVRHAAKAVEDWVGFYREREAQHEVKAI